jgi:integrase
MARRQHFDDKLVANLPVTGKAYAKPDVDLVGHYVRVSMTGIKTFATVVRGPDGKQVWTTVGRADVMTIRQSRDRAKAIIQRVKDGLPATDEKPRLASYAEVYAEYFKREVKAKALISADQIDWSFGIYVLPDWGKRDFVSIRRGDVVALLDKLEDERGRRTADIVLAYTRRVANWYAIRNEDYQSPFVKGMARRKPGESKRARILTDDEIRAVWGAADGPYGVLAKLALLTAQRRDKLATMRWSDLAGGVWTVPHEGRQKGTGGALTLPKIALEILAALPRFDSSDFVFSEVGDGNGFSGFSKGHNRLIESSEVKNWTLHDLRRTARSLMSRAGVQSDHAERVLGHVISGVEGIYDRHLYADEKAQALAKLADVVAMILNPPVGNVVTLRGAK